MDTKNGRKGKAPRANGVLLMRMRTGYAQDASLHLKQCFKLLEYLLLMYGELGGAAWLAPFTAVSSLWGPCSPRRARPGVPQPGERPRSQTRRPEEVAMTVSSSQHDEHLAALPLPLRSVGIESDLGIEHLPAAVDRVFGHRHVESDGRPCSRTQFAVIDVGEIACAVGRTSPLISIQEQPQRASIFLCYAGQPRYIESRRCSPLQPRTILVNPNHGGQYRSGYSANVCFQVQRPVLQRTILAMGGVPVERVLEDPCIWGCDPLCTGSKLFDLFGFIDQLLAHDRSLPSALGLDDQIYRMLALSILMRDGHADRLERRFAPGGTPGSRLDALVDYIRANAGKALTLTDLEVQSHYSARHLQSLFRDALDCTPMQFVRRQRLSLAMERLQTARPGDTVTRIARDCGYRHLSNFSADFQRQFGVNPSAVLRGSTEKGATGL